MALLQRNKRRLFFSSKINRGYNNLGLNEEPAEYDLHSQFQHLMTSSIKGRTDMLKMISVPSNARTGSTAETEHT